MHRSLPMKSRCFFSLIVVAGLAASTAAFACANSKDGVSVTIPSAEPEIVLAANTNQDASSEAPAPVPASPHTRFRDAESLFEHPISWLFMSSGPKSGVHLSGAERTSRPVDHKGALANEARGRRASHPTRVFGDFGTLVGRPHRMPGPEIL
jgi:hypothetical protein